MARGDNQTPQVTARDSMNLIETLHEQKRRVMAFAYVAIDKDGRLHFAKSAMTKAQYEELREFLGGKFEVTAFGQGIK